MGIPLDLDFEKLVPAGVFTPPVRDYFLGLEMSSIVRDFYGGAPGDESAVVISAVRYP